MALGEVGKVGVSIPSLEDMRVLLDGIPLEKVSISIQEKEEEVEFFLILQFDSLDSVRSFAGENYETAYIPENARQVLSRYDETAQHYELTKELIF